MIARGSVYFVTDGEAIKIGFSWSPVARTRELQVGTHKALTLLYECPGTHDDERALHRRFEHIWIRGEWFQKSSEIEALVAYLPKVRRAMRFDGLTVLDVADQLLGPRPDLRLRPRITASITPSANRRMSPMHGPSKIAKDMEAWIEKHRAVMTPEELHISGFAKNAADQLAHTRNLRPADQERYKKFVADWLAIGPGINARVAV